MFRPIMAIIRLAKGMYCFLKNTELVIFRAITVNEV